VSHADALNILTVEETMRICEEVFLMHSRDTVVPRIPPAFKLEKVSLALQQFKLSGFAKMDKVLFRRMWRHWVYEQAKARDLGMLMPAAHE
jgi:hypothetical protein